MQSQAIVLVVLAAASVCPSLAKRTQQPVQEAVEPHDDSAVLTVSGASNLVDQGETPQDDSAYVPEASNLVDPNDPPGSQVPGGLSESLVTKLQRTLQSNKTKAPGDSPWMQRGKSVYFCDCGTLKDTSDMSKHDTRPMDWYVDWLAWSRHNQLIAKPSEYSAYYTSGLKNGQDDESLIEFTKIYDDKDSCMGGCMAQCQEKHGTHKVKKDGVKGMFGFKKNVESVMPFARCIPKSDFTCMWRYAQSHGGPSQGSIAAKAEKIQVHDIESLQVVPDQNEGLTALLTNKDSSSFEMASIRFTFEYTDATYEDHDECSRNCGRVAKDNGYPESYQCDFYPAALLFHDRKDRSSMYAGYDTVIKNPKPYWGCCTASFYPARCNLDYAQGLARPPIPGSADEVSLERWRIPEDYFEQACEDGSLPDKEEFHEIAALGGLDVKDCKEESMIRVELWSYEGCRSHIKGHLNTRFTSTYSSR